ncbi:MAG: biotin--[acetyl-CoA-carboxylase] ligase [Planctomycetaceae bacterium]|nr:biotin--[acetyl-CoA-carboxylase] ligase [Planctomycetaceae bacterium]
MDPFTHNRDLRNLMLRETFVRTVESYEEIDSTNTRALAIVGDVSVEHPCLIIADRQTAGRGRGANRWWSSEGSLTFSLLLSHDIRGLPLARWPELSLTVGTAVCETVRTFLPAGDVRLKWPNDVFLNNRKTCGVLVEVPPAPQGTIVIGIGLNVNNSLQRAPEELRQTAIAMCDVADQPLSPDRVLVSLLNELERQMKLLQKAPDQVRETWRKFDLLLGRNVTVGHEHGAITGTAQGIDDDGALLIQTQAGLRNVYGGVVQSFD